MGASSSCGLTVESRSCGLTARSGLCELTIETHGHWDIIYTRAPTSDGQSQWAANECLEESIASPKQKEEVLRGALNMKAQHG